MRANLNRYAIAAAAALAARAPEDKLATPWEEPT